MILPQAAKLQRVFAASKDEITIMLRPLQLNGLVSQKTEGVFVINPAIEPLLVRFLKKKELL